MRLKQMKKLLSGIVCSLIMVSCGEDMPDYYPKPDGFLRMEFPERVFTEFHGNCPYRFEVPDYFVVDPDTATCHADINIDRFNAVIYLTYIPLDTTSLAVHIEKSRKFVYDHSIRADAIEEQIVQDDSRRAYGLKYNIVGDAASQYQFYMTDSINHFLRGALYFNTKPNYDSLRPSLSYIVEDIDHLIETLNWDTNE